MAHRLIFCHTPFPDRFSEGQTRSGKAFPKHRIYQTTKSGTAPVFKTSLGIRPQR